MTTAAATTLDPRTGDAVAPATGAVDITVSLVNWNTAADLRRCLESLFTQDHGVSLQVVVVDNGSTDDSVAMTRDHFPQVQLIANPSHRGFATGNHQVRAVGRGRYLLYLNTDTQVCPGALRDLVGFMDGRPTAAAAGPRLLNGDGSTQDSWWRGFPGVRKALSDALYLFKLARPVPAGDTEPFAVDHLLGACILFRVSAIDRVGFVDEAYNVYFEETDLCFRLQQDGGTIWHLPGARVFHFGQASGNKNPTWSTLQQHRNYLRFCRKNGVCGPLQLAALKAVFMLGAVIRIGLWTLRLTRRDRALCLGRIRGYWNVLWRTPAM